MECWNKLDGNVGELSSWVATKVFIGIIIAIVTVIIIIDIVFDIDKVIGIVFDIVITPRTPRLQRVEARSRLRSWRLN